MLTLRIIFSNLGYPFCLRISKEMSRRGPTLQVNRMSPVTNWSRDLFSRPCKVKLGTVPGERTGTGYRGTLTAYKDSTRVKN